MLPPETMTADRRSRDGIQPSRTAARAAAPGAFGDLLVALQQQQDGARDGLVADREQVVDRARG